VLVSFLRIFLLLLNIAVAVLLVLSYACVQVSPLTFYPFAFIGLGFPILVVLNVFFLVFFTSQFSLRALISLIALLAVLPLVKNLVQVNPLYKNSVEKNARSKGMLKVTSYNVRLFDLYNWSNNKKTRDRMLDFLRKENSDILLFQEFYSDDDNAFTNADSLEKHLGMEHHAEHYTITLRKTNHWGMALYSRYPIVRSGAINFSTRSNNSCLFADIAAKGDTVRVYNIHLQSLHFKKEDYDFIDSLTSEGNARVESMKGSRRIASKIKQAFIKRAEQVELVHKHMQSSPYPVVLAGDFNDSPVSYSYQRLSQGLQDAWVGHAFGFGQTFHDNLFNLRIDYILHSEEIYSDAFAIRKVPYSDHYPVSCFIGFSHGRE
jgi:endonuclease/exonuclease/phosphatase family metal-dependent hydrolase